MTRVLRALVTICSQVFPSPHQTGGLLCAQMVYGPERRNQEGGFHRCGGGSRTPRSLHASKRGYHWK